MIALERYREKTVAVLGLGRSGVATARALAAGGARVLAWDDDPARRRAAEVRALAPTDLGDVDFGGVAALVPSPGVPLTHPAPTRSWRARARPGARWSATSTSSPTPAPAPPWSG